MHELGLTFENLVNPINELVVHSTAEVVDILTLKDKSDSRVVAILGNSNTRWIENAKPVGLFVEFLIEKKLCKMGQKVQIFEGFRFIKSYKKEHDNAMPYGGQNLWQDVPTGDFYAMMIDENTQYLHRDIMPKTKQDLKKLLGKLNKIDILPDY